MVWYPPSTAFVEQVHKKIMFDLGYGPQPLTGPDRLAGALGRVQMYAQYDEDADIPAQAARLAEAVSQAQGFLEGNKRTAYALMMVFLAKNGYRVVFNGIAIADWLIGIAEAHAANSGVNEQIQTFVEFVQSTCIRQAPPPSQ